MKIKDAVAQRIIDLCKEKNIAINALGNRQKTSIPITKAENQKLYLPKRNHARLAPCSAADA